MASNADPLICKESFLQENQLFSEIDLTDDSKPIGKLQEIDIVENEIWLLQCPKDLDVTQLENETLKMPGRTNLNNFEAITMEFNEGKQQQAFAYCNRKGRYALRLLPVRGTIVVRDRLKTAESVTIERAEELCPPAKRVPLPSNIRVRHPLLGANYLDKIEMEKSIAKRLQKADEISAKFLKESLKERSKSTIHIKNLTSKKVISNSPMEINSGDDEDAVEFVSEEKFKKKKKSKRKHSESDVPENVSDDYSKTKKKKSKKSKKHDNEISKDLQWLQNI
ncbi:uncharacterized protein ACRADG_003374 [Cochliomyia hominivorax]